MGYTNYWTPNKKFQKTGKEFDPVMLGIMKRAVEHYNGKQKDPKMKLQYALDSTHVELFGEPATYETLNIVLEPDPTYGRFGIDNWFFCKTAREPYDVVVKLFLSLLQYFGVIDDWSHDDNNACAEYRRARQFAQEVLTDTEYDLMWLPAKR